LPLFRLVGGAERRPGFLLDVKKKRNNREKIENQIPLFN